MSTLIERYKRPPQRRPPPGRHRARDRQEPVDRPPRRTPRHDQPQLAARRAARPAPPRSALLGPGRLLRMLSGTGFGCRSNQRTSVPALGCHTPVDYGRREPGSDQQEARMTSDQQHPSDSRTRVRRARRRSAGPAAIGATAWSPVPSSAQPRPSTRVKYRARATPSSRRTIGGPARGRPRPAALSGGQPEHEFQTADRTRPPPAPGPFPPAGPTAAPRPAYASRLGQLPPA